MHVAYRSCARTGSPYQNKAPAFKSISKITQLPPCCYSIKHIITCLRSKTPSGASCNKPTNLVVSKPRLFSCLLKGVSGVSTSVAMLSRCVKFCVLTYCIRIVQVRALSCMHVPAVYIRSAVPCVNIVDGRLGDDRWQQSAIAAHG